MPEQSWDAVVVGSGPNGLAAAIVLAQSGASVLLLEAKETVGGGMRTAELTLPGFHHDVCSACHPMGVLSPFFRSLPLEEHGLRWVRPEASVAHPLDGEPAGGHPRQGIEPVHRAGELRQHAHQPVMPRDVHQFVQQHQPRRR